MTPLLPACLTGVRAVLWDMDGLLVDSEPLWTVAEEDLAASLGAVWTDDIKAACMGRRFDTAVPIMLAGLGQPVDADGVAAASAFLLGRMVALFGEGVPVLPGVLELLRTVDAAGVPQALVSSSYRVLVDAVTAALPDVFAVTVAGDEVERAKPDPEPYLRAAAALGVEPAACLVLEDSTSGALAGVAAGCRVVVVPGEHGPRDPDERWTTTRSLEDVLR